jgi:hypothetical protein
MYSDRILPKFRRNVLPPSSGKKNKPSKEEAKPLYLLLHVIYIGPCYYEIEITVSWGMCVRWGTIGMHTPQNLEGKIS